MTSPAKLTGQRSRCAACATTFTSTCSFDAHRVGRFGIDRRCKTTEELRALGWEPNAHGYWRLPAPEGAFAMYTQGATK